MYRASVSTITPNGPSNSIISFLFDKYILPFPHLLWNNLNLCSGNASGHMALFTC